MRISLRWKITILIVLLVFLVINGVRFLVIEKDKEVLTNKSIEGVVAIAKYIAKPAGEAIFDSEFLILGNLTNEAIKHHDIVYCYIIDKDNIVRGFSSKIKKTNKEIRNKPYVETRKLSFIKQNKTMTVREDKESKIYDIEIPIVLAGKYFGKTKVGLSLLTIEEFVKKTTKRAVIMTLAILVIGVLGAFLLAHFLVGPIKLLVDATVSIAKGDFNKRLKVKSHDELGDLTRAFNTMAEGLKQREEMKGAFSRLVSQDVMKEILKDPNAVKLGGEKREITVLISDVRGFTSTSEKLAPEEVVGLLNKYLEEMTDIIFKNKGTLDKYMGDGILALFGAPKSYGDDPVSAVTAAIHMKSALAKLQKEWNRITGKELKIGVGINTAEVVVGYMGSSKKMEYTVIGDGVNLCSRIESLNKEFGTTILISEYTYNKVKDYFEARDKGEAMVKGKAKPVRVFEILGFKKQELNPS